jgi:hypothetical protein
VLAVILLVVFALPDHDVVRVAAARPRPVRLLHADVSVSLRGGARSVPRSFLGLSTEYWDVPVYARRLGPFERILSLLHVHRDGPFVLRIGGDSADRSLWDPGAQPMPRWVFELTPRWLQRTSSLVHRTGVRLILNLNLVTGSPSIAAQWAGAAEGGLPHGSVIGFEIGNEPDIYSRRYWLATVAAPRLGTRVLPYALSASSYTQDFRSYAEAVARVASLVPLVGPALARPALDTSWIRALIEGAVPGLRTLSAHSYPLSACAKRASRAYPTIARVLSERASAGLAHSVKAAVLLAHRAGLPFRLTELNSVTCEGRPGVSNTFATALWAPDTLFELLRTGVDGVNVHVRTNAINAAFTPTTHGLQARPLLYGLILFASTLGPNAQLIGSRIHTTGSLHLKVWAVRVRGDVLHVLLIDKSNRSAALDLHLPALGPATVERLLAPSVRSSSGVTLAGRELGDDDRWHGRLTTQILDPGARGYELTIAATSAVLLRVQLRPSPAGIR